LTNNDEARNAMLVEINNILINPTVLEQFVIGDNFNRNVICQVTQTVPISWGTQSEQRRNITAKIRFTIQEINRIDSLLNMFQLEPCKMAYKDGKFHFSNWFHKFNSFV